uniref:Nudix hydrolase domain-containing protein n=1 Tax=Alexandrium monilatum TaxID=311494 RepID=A0A7S4Q1W7_9DINO|mmetsp:Transcript_65741/g.205857  ORF Transcript_65741/g.205857 Transcript_65741/m.205857 type:complete len:235 (-) Transcript_65741:121-825(-)
MLCYLARGQAALVAAAALGAAWWGPKLAGLVSGGAEGGPGVVVPRDRSLFYWDERDLRHVTPTAQRIPQDVYAHIVADFIIPCVDVLLEAPDGRFLIVVRKDEPMAGHTWMIGGRMLKGETFFDTALRKVREEVGLDASELQPERVLSVWNTFFNASVHVPRAASEGSTADRAGRGPATQTVNTVVHVTLRDGARSPALDEHHSGFRWVGPSDASLAGLDRYVLAAVQERRRQA